MTTEPWNAWESNGIHNIINSDKDGLSRTIRAGYYKAGFANYIHDDGRAANAVLIINRV